MLGDRIRMNAINNPRVYMRSLAHVKAIWHCQKCKGSHSNFKGSKYDLIILKLRVSAKVIRKYWITGCFLYVMTPEYGAATQLEKIDMLDFADVIALK